MSHLKIDYVEFCSPDLKTSRAFFETAFGWTFADHGPSYAAMSNAGIDGGIAESPANPPLVILKTNDLAAAELAVTRAGGAITKPAFGFPGGRRFHFREPGGNELAVWSEK
jgi:uncharacterized protein